MSDSGEGLVDASSRLAERMEELEDARRQAKNGGPRIDPEKVRADVRRQLAVISHEARRQQLTNALAEIDRRLADLERTA
jgi:predicted  nucleic acid-binding Zn-ribbon protein